MLIFCNEAYQEMYGFCFQKTHFSVVQVTQRAEAMLQSQHYNSELVRAIAENVTLAWQQLMYHAEERQKLVMASTNWYKTAEQVCQNKHGAGTVCVQIYCIGIPDLKHILSRFAHHKYQNMPVVMLNEHLVNQSILVRNVTLCVFIFVKFVMSPYLV